MIIQRKERLIKVSAETCLRTTADVSIDTDTVVTLSWIASNGAISMSISLEQMITLMELYSKGILVLILVLQ